MPIAHRRSFAASCRLGLQAIRNSPETSLVSIILVGFATLCFLGAELAIARLAQLVKSLADGSTGPMAQLDISRCPQCERPGSPLQSPESFIHMSRVTAVTVRHVSRRGTVDTRSVPVHCVSPSRPPRSVRWTTRREQIAWSDAVGTATVVVGAELATWVERSALRTANGPWTVLGLARMRPTLAADASVNTAVLVPNRPPFSRLCARGTPVWQIVADDSVHLARRIHMTTDALRTALTLHPRDTSPWRYVRLDRFAVLVQKLVTRFRWAVFIGPFAIMMLCAAGVFSVQTLQGAQRISEFGVQRAVGASNTMLLGQLATEATVLGAAGFAVATLCLLITGLLQVGDADLTRLLTLSLIVVMPMMAAGVLIPGLVALRASSIAHLEGRGA